MAFKVSKADKDGNMQSCMIFRKDGQYGPMYSTEISRKNQDGTYKKSYISLYFDKGVELENKSVIFIKEASLEPTNDKNKVAMRVWKYDYDTGFRRVEEDDFSPF